MRRAILFAAAAVWALSASAQSLEEVADERIFSFEKSVAPFVAERGSSLEISGDHYKHGTHSVRWQWSRPNAQLRIDAPIDYLSKNPNPRETSVSTFVFWVYAPKALTGNLRFEFRKAGRTCAWFDYGLDFTGWRGAWVAFDRDMQGTPEEGMDELVVTVEGARRGELYFDHWILASFQDVRHHTADFQAPFINAGTTSHWLVLLESWRNPMPAAPATLDESMKRDMATVETRLRELLLEGKKPLPLETLRNHFEQYGITENPDGTLRGKPIWFVRYAETYITMGHPAVAKLYAANDQLLRGYNDYLFQLAVAWEAATDPAERAELERMYILSTRHLLDQGFAAGSALGTLHHLGYSMRNFYTAPVIMREVLRKAGLEHDVQQAMEWFSGVGEVKLPPSQPGMDIDAFNTSLIGRLASIVLLSDTPQKKAYLSAFSRWVDNGYKITEGTGPCFKSDGTVFHHRHHYPAYAVDGFSGGAVNAVWLLSKTRFAVSEESHAILKRALLEMRFYCNLRSFPLALSGRHPDGRGALIPWHYARLAVAGSPDGREEIDRELAAAYLRVNPAEDRYTRLFTEAGLTAEPSPEGTHVYGYNASLSHRRGDWLVTVAGHSRYLWAAEIYQGCNHYGRYLTNGSLQLLGDGDPVSAFGSGFRQEGWDWCHVPGTTALEIPMEQMKADIRNVDTFSGYEEMLLSDEAFVGGVSLQGRNGLFAMQLHDHDKYNGTLRARKSFFLFDNRIVCLGSDIENRAEGGVHTTLFQNFLENGSDPIEVNGEQVTAFPYERTLAQGALLRDNLRNLYIVPQGSVCVGKRHQHSLHEETDAPTENDFATAWIDHGEGEVNGADYEYLMVVHASDREAARYAEELPYEVLRRDSTAHIVSDRLTGIVGYALFCGGEVGEGWLERVSMPSLVMIGGGEKTLTVSVCDPDLRFYEGPSDEVFDAGAKRVERSIYSRMWIDNPSGESRLEVTLRGCWQLGEASETCRAEIDGDRTVLTFTCREGATREVKLTKQE